MRWLRPWPCSMQRPAGALRQANFEEGTTPGAKPCPPGAECGVNAPRYGDTPSPPPSSQAGAGPSDAPSPHCTRLAVDFMKARVRYLLDGEPRRRPCGCAPHRRRRRLSDLGDGGLCDQAFRVSREFSWHSAGVVGARAQPASQRRKSPPCRFTNPHTTRQDLRRHCPCIPALVRNSLTLEGLIPVVSCHRPALALTDAHEQPPDGVVASEEQALGECPR